MSTFEKNKEVIDNFYQESLDSFFEKTEFYMRIKTIMDKFDIEEIHQEFSYDDFWKKSIVRRIFQVHERVLLVRHFRQKQKEVYDTMTAHMYPALCTYLLLTCFDQLGQPSNGWVFFPQWLESKKNKVERDKILEVIDSGLDNIEFSKKLFENYHEIYGVRSSFFRFFREILPPNQRQTLLDQISIERYNSSPEETYYEYGSYDEKEKWLYEVRNSYTHNSYFTEKPILIGNIDSAGKHWIWREQSYKANIRQTILVSEDFNDEIERAVLSGITELIKANS